MSKLRSRLSISNINSYVSNVFTEGAKFSRPIKEIQSGSVSTNVVEELEPIVVSNEFQEQGDNEFHGQLPEEAGQVPEVEGFGEQELSTIPDQELPGEVTEGVSILDTEGVSGEGSEVGVDTKRSDIPKRNRVEFISHIPNEAETIQHKR